VVQGGNRAIEGQAGIVIARVGKIIIRAGAGAGRLGREII
jgi:hypothetical protein